MFTVIITIINACFTCISVTCAFCTFCQAKKQTNIMQKQLEESQKPDFPTTMRLESIANSILSVKQSIDKLSDRQ